MNTPLYFVTSNDDKFHEMSRALATCPVDLQRVSLDLPEIQSLDPREVAGYKAERGHAALMQQKPRLHDALVMVEDTGLAIDAWNGFPGALIKWVLESVGEAGLCRQLDAWPDRRATATVVLSVSDGQSVQHFIGQAHGLLVSAPRGAFGFGWDSIFQPEGYNQTYGEMPREEKIGISMRGRAAAALREFLLARAD